MGSIGPRPAAGGARWSLADTIGSRSVGLAGPDGIPATDCLAGTIGSRGPDGIPGTDRLAGPDGIPGTDGIPATDRVAGPIGSRRLVATGPVVATGLGRTGWPPLLGGLAHPVRPGRLAGATGSGSPALAVRPGRTDPGSRDRLRGAGDPG